MLKSYWCVMVVVVVAYRILVSAPVPFGFRSYWDLVGVGPRGFWRQGLTPYLFSLERLNNLHSSCLLVYLDYLVTSND